MKPARLPIALLGLIGLVMAGIPWAFGEERSPETVELEITVGVEGQTSEVDPVAAVVRLQRLGAIQRRAVAAESSSGGVSAQERSVKLRVPGSARVALPADGLWRLVLDAPGLWAPEQTWGAGASGGVVLAALPTGDLVGRAVPPPDADKPEQLEARFQASDLPASENDPERHTVECRLDARINFQCAIPSGRYDVRLRAPGFVSHYFWNLDVPPNGEVDLEQLRLLAGSSLVGWVRAESPPEDFTISDVTANLLLETAGLQEMAEDHQRRQLLAMETRPNEHGFLEFTGMMPGTYQLAVSHPAFATTRFSPVTIAEGAETEVERIVLRPPRRLGVAVSPPRDPRGRPWFLGLSRHSEVPGHLDRVAQGVADAEGRWRTGGLDSGHYRLMVANGDGERWASREVQLDEEVAEIQIDLPFERVEGRVTVAGEPLPGVEVWFGGRHGEVRVSDVTDEEGAVYVIVPERDTWLVEVRSKKPPIMAQVDEVDVYDHPSQPWKRAEIELADTDLSGVVLGPGGQPVAEAKVRLTREEAPPRFFIERTDEDGQFAVQAIKEGRWRLQAEWLDEVGRRWLSDGVEVALEDEDAREVELQLRRSWTFAGQIVGPGGAGVYGAEVSGLPVYPDGGERGTYLAQEITGLSGEFELEIPAEAVAVRLTVLPPGFTARKWPPFERGTEPQVLAMDRYGGTLRIFGLDVSSTSTLPGLPTVFSSDERWSLSTLIRWARMSGGEVGHPSGDLVIPGMPADSYRICLPGTRSSAAKDREVAGCTGGELAPYSELTLEIPTSER